MSWQPRQTTTEAYGFDSNGDSKPHRHSGGEGTGKWAGKEIVSCTGVTVRIDPESLAWPPEASTPHPPRLCARPSHACPSKLLMGTDMPAPETRLCPSMCLVSTGATFPPHYTGTKLLVQESTAQLPPRPCKHPKALSHGERFPAEHRPRGRFLALPLTPHPFPPTAGAIRWLLCLPHPTRSTRRTKSTLRSPSVSARNGSTPPGSRPLCDFRPWRRAF